MSKAVILAVLLLLAGFSSAAALEFDIDFDHNNADTVVYLFSVRDLHTYEAIYSLEIDFSFNELELEFHSFDFSVGPLSAWGGMVWSCDNSVGDCRMAGAGIAALSESGILVRAVFLKVAGTDEEIDGRVAYTELRANEDYLPIPDYVLSVSEIEAPLPRDFTLRQNYPNPFNPHTTIEFSIARRSDVALSIYNVLGREVYRENHYQLAAGSYRFEWDATDQAGRPVASGVYFYRLQAGEQAQTRTMVLLK